MTIKKHFTIGIYGIQDINNTIIPTMSHDHGICIMQNGKVLFNAQLERINRKKHSDAMPEMIYDLLKNKKLFNQNCVLIFTDNVLGRSFINAAGNIRFEAPLSEKLHTSFEKGRLWWLNKQKEAFVLNHELAHIGSCLPFFGGFKNNSLMIHFDGGASLSNFSVWHYINGEIKNIKYDWNFKWLSGLFNSNALTFALVNAKPHDLNSVPGKFMGFASFGSYNEEIEDWLIQHNFFNDIWGSKKVFLEQVKLKFGLELKAITQKNKILQNIAATIHHIFVRELFNEIKTLQTLIKANYLYYSGGSALNIVLNTKIIKSELFKDVFIPPCCNDSGLALGAAAFYEWKKHGRIETGTPFLNNWGIEQYKSEFDHFTIKKVVELLLNKKIIAICNNYGEVGPRALGNRSIICLASSKKLAQKVSMTHKKREWYRPVAPIMLEKNCSYFANNNTVHHLANYMLMDFEIDKNKQKEIEGAVHVDGTARIQTISHKNDNPFMFEILNELDQKHNIKALINTSFNIKGEPIVHTIDDARKSAVNMKLDAVVLNGRLEVLL